MRAGSFEQDANRPAATGAVPSTLRCAQNNVSNVRSNKNKDLTP